jgi:hypothetical protein
VIELVDSYVNTMMFLRLCKDQRLRHRHSFTY